MAAIKKTGIKTTANTAAATATAASTEKKTTLKAATTAKPAAKTTAAKSTTAKKPAAKATEKKAPAAKTAEKKAAPAKASAKTTEKKAPAKTADKKAAAKTAAKSPAKKTSAKKAAVTIDTICTKLQKKLPKTVRFKDKIAVDIEVWGFEDGSNAKMYIEANEGKITVSPHSYDEKDFRVAVSFANAKAFVDGKMTFKELLASPDFYAEGKIVPAIKLASIF